MSTTMKYSDLEPETRENIEYMRQQMPTCACHPRGDRWHICDYHEGYDDGVAFFKLRQ